jgi:hypothetical protein
MKVYFSEANHSDIDQFGDDGIFTVHTENGARYFYCGVEHGTNPGGLDEVAIFDGCNRMVPIAIENVPALVEALNYCYNNVEKLKEAERMQKRLDSDNTVSFVEGDDYPYVEEV